MDSRITGALLGMIAGDGYVQVRERTRGNRTYVCSEMYVRHSSQQRAYCEHKLALCREFLGTKATLREFKHGPGNKYDGVGFYLTHDYFKMLKGWTYTNGKKSFNEVWLKHMTPEGVALWYMDDGHARRNYNKKGQVTSVSTNIATCCPEAEADLICNWFWEEHKIRFKKFREKQYWSITANTEDSRLFAHLVRPYIIEAMLYKISHVADLNSHECRTPIAKCVTCEGGIYDNRHGGLCSSCYSRRYRERTKKSLGDDIVRPARKRAEVVDKEPPR